MTDKAGTVTVDQVEILRDYEHQMATQIVHLWEQSKVANGSFSKAEDISEVKRFLNATSTADTTNTYSDHAHNTHRPKLSQIADTLEAHYMRSLLPNDEWMQFTPDEGMEDSVRTSRRIEAYIRNRHRLYNHRSVVNNLIRDWIEHKTICEVVWTEEVAHMPVEGMPEYGYVGPKIRRLSADQVAYDHKARSFHDSWKIVQTVKTYGDLAKEIQDSELPESYREILKDTMKYRHHIRQFPEVFTDEWANADFGGWGSNGYYFNHSNSVELLTFYGTIYDVEKDESKINKKIVIVDRKWVLLEEDIETWDGKPHIYMSYWRDKPDSLEGMCPLENLTGMQYSINHLQNSKADAIDEVVTSDRIISGIDDVKTLPDGTKEYWAHEPGARVNVIAPDVQILQADFHIETLERKMEEYAGVPRSAAGIKVPGEQTKFEVQTLADAGSLLFQAKIEKFEREILAPALNAELELARRNLDQNLQVLVSEVEGDIFRDINADLMKNKGTLVARGAQHYAQQAKVVQELTQFMQNLQAMPQLQVHFPADRIAKIYDRLLGAFGTKDGLYEKFGQIAENVESQQMQQVAATIIDDSAAAEQQLVEEDLQQ